MASSKVIGVSLILKVIESSAVISLIFSTEFPKISVDKFENPNSPKKTVSASPSIPSIEILLPSPVSVDDKNILRKYHHKKLLLLVLLFILSTNF